MPLESKEVIIWAEFSLSHFLCFFLILTPFTFLFTPCLHLPPYLSLALPACVLACVSLSLSVHWLNFNLKRAVWPWPSNFSALCFSFPIFITGNIITACSGTLSITRKSFIKENAFNRWWAVSPTLWVRTGGGERLRVDTTWPPSDANEPMWVNGLLTLASTVSLIQPRDILRTWFWFKKRTRRSWEICKDGWGGVSSKVR